MNGTIVGTNSDGVVGALAYALNDCEIGCANEAPLVSSRVDKTYILSAYSLSKNEDV